jgi:hypothetical protein
MAVIIIPEKGLPFPERGKSPEKFLPLLQTLPDVIGKLLAINLKQSTNQLITV